MTEMPIRRKKLANQNLKKNVNGVFCCVHAYQTVIKYSLADREAQWNQIRFRIKRFKNE
jgi:hypothetical protein